MQSNNKCFGFTIAEILIAIGIIGVSTLLLTTLFQINKNTTWQKSNDYKLGIVKYDKIYNALNENITKQLMRNNDISNLNNLLANALNTLNSTCTDCANNRANNPLGNNLPNLSKVLSDNSEITVYSYNGIIDNNDIRYIVYVDTNGKEKPNTIGKDILPIYIDKDGNVINVNPKTGRKFEKLTQKKYDDTKIYTFQCPNEDTVLSLRKNSETGLYEDIDNKKCSKICDENYAKTVYANYLKNALNLETIPDITKNKNIFKYGTDSDDIIYSSEYDKYNCFSVKPDKCTLNGAKKYFKEFFDKSPYNLLVNKNNITNSGKTLSYEKNGIKYSANYNEENCNINSSSVKKECLSENLKSKFKTAIGNKCTPSSITNPLTCKSNYITYSASYNTDTCEIVKPTSATCTYDDAKQKFAGQVGVSSSQIQATSGGFSYKSSSKEYTATYNSSSCYTNYNEKSNTKCRVDITFCTSAEFSFLEHTLKPNCSKISGGYDGSGFSGCAWYSFYCTDENIIQQCKNLNSKKSPHACEVSQCN